MKKMKTTCLLLNILSRNKEEYLSKEKCLDEVKRSETETTFAFVMKSTNIIHLYPMT